MNQYTQVKEYERIRIFNGLKEGLTQKDIAIKTGRSASTISREIARNSDLIGYLYSKEAQEKTKNRRRPYSFKINRIQGLKDYILEKIAIGWAPGVIAGRWNKEHQRKDICAESIYQFIYHKDNRALTLWKLLPRAKRKRGYGRKCRSRGGIMHRISIHERPEDIETREIIGHYEGDLMFNRGSQSENILTIVERKSRVVSLTKHMTKHSKLIIESVHNNLDQRAKSITFDNGKEFALHYTLPIKTFFCDPGILWQKGSVENMNGLLRRYIPFSLTPGLVTQEYLDRVANIVNNTPRKILEYLTPNEVFMQNLKIEEDSRMKSAQPAAEVFYQSFSDVALHN
jgi:IS30 family transposase